MKSSWLNLRYYTGIYLEGRSDQSKFNSKQWLYKGADKSLARPTSRRILFDGENISFGVSLVTYINSTNIPLIMIKIGYMKIKIFCRCSSFPSWQG
jgi:hypothetical protein